MATKLKYLIAVPFTDKFSSAAIRRAQKDGMSIAELRIDLYSSYKKKYVLKEVLKFKKIGTIATIRSRKEGGAWKGSEKERLELFKAVLPHVDKIDVELSSAAILKKVVSEAHRLKKTVIVSYHNFQKIRRMFGHYDCLISKRVLGLDGLLCRLGLPLYIVSWFVEQQIKGEWDAVEFALRLLIRVPRFQLV